VDRRTLRDDLERVIAKALAPDAGQRYGTAAALAAEIGRFLAGRPVEAHPPSRTYRVRRYLGRHRAGAIATAVAVASLLVATTVSLRQARIAERRLGEVRELANRFLFELEESIRDLPGATRARESAVRVGLVYLDRLALETGADRGQRRELAEGDVKLGDVQGGVDRANLGDTKGALASYRKAIALLEPDFPEGRAEPGEQLALLRAWTSAAAIEGKEGESELALARLDRSIALATALAERDAADSDARLARSLAHFRRATILQTERSDLEGARRAFDAALADAGDGASTGTGEFDRDRVLGRIRVGRAVLETQSGNFVAAKEELERARKSDERLLMRQPTSALVRQWLAADFVRLADTHLYLGELDAAAERGEEGLRRYEELFADDPANRQAEYFVAWAANRLSAIRSDRNEIAAAERAAGRALEIVRGMLAREPESARNLWLVALGEHRVASLASTRGAHAAASASFQRAIDSYRGAMAVDPKNAVYEIDLGASTGNLADSRAAAGDPEGALARYRDELEIGDRRRGPDAGPRPELLRLHALAGMAEIELGRGEAASGCEHARLAVESAASVPDDPDVALTRTRLERLLRGCAR
jgi:tetratricopeptide (TPR) repeat protein